MDFITKRFNSIFGIAIFSIITLGVMYLLMSIFPYILIIGLIIWMFVKVVKTLKSFNRKKESVVNSMSDADNNTDSNEYTNGQIIDVEYKEL